MNENESNFVNPYEQIWKTRDLSSLDKPVEVENNLSPFRRGLGRFGKQMQEVGYALPALGAQAVENVIGKNDITSGIVDWGREGYKKAAEEASSGIYAPTVPNIESIKSASDAFDWVGGILGEQLPLVAGMALTGGVGGLVARSGAGAVSGVAKAAVGSAVKQAVEKGALKAAAGQLITQEMKDVAAKELLATTMRGATAGAFAGTAGLEGGLAFGEQTSQGVDPAKAVMPSLAVGGINGALELVTPYVVAKKIGMGEYAKQSIKKIIETNPDLAKRAVAIAKEVSSRAAKGAAEGALTEGLTESLQELTSIAGERWARNDPLFDKLTDADWSRVINSGVAGAVVGGGLSGPGATLGGPHEEQDLSGGRGPGRPAPKQEKTPEEKLQELEKIKVNLGATLDAAKKEGDVEKAAEIQSVVDLYDKAINETKAQIEAIKNPPVTEVPVTEKPVTDVPMTEAPITEVPDTKIPVTEQQPTVENSTAPTPALSERPPTSEVLPTQSSETPVNPNIIQLKRGEDIILTPSGKNISQSTPEEQEKLRQFMGERPAKEEQPTSPSTDGNKPEPLYSKPIGEKPAPTFYSGLERALQDIKQEKASSPQWEGTINSLIKNGAVKKEELEWSGTKEWLKEQKGPVTKEALLQYVRDNTLEIQETKLGASGLSARLNDLHNWEIVDNQGNILDTFENYHAENPTEALAYSELEQPRNAKWTLPGGENQHELVLTVPSIEPFNTKDATHYGDVGGGRAVAWVRFNDRIDKDGKKTLFLEEIQSKRHQEGKEKGYQSSVKERIKQRKIEDNLFSRIENLGISIYGNPDDGGRVLKPLDVSKLPNDIRVEYENYIKNTIESRQSNRIPDAPFKQTIAGSGQTLSGWAGLAFKRMLRYAAENGYDKVAWTTGKQQAERYNLSKQIDSIAYDPNSQLFVAQKDGKNLIKEEGVTKDKLDSLVGKEVAEKLLKTDTGSSAWKHRLSGLDLNVGGEGMKGFYDRLLPNEINKYVKKWGTKVDQTQMQFGDESASVHSVEITPAMRDSVMQGQPLYSKSQKEKAIVTPEMDAEYLAAVKRGDMETAQRMVDRASEDRIILKFGKDTESVGDFISRHELSRDGRFVVLYHATPKTTNLNNILRNGSYLDKRKDKAAFFAARDRGLKSKDIVVHKVLVHPSELEYVGHYTINKDIPLNRKNKDYVDTIIYDNSKNIIPLSQRFNDKHTDTHYTKQTDTTNIPLQDFHSKINSIMGEGWLQKAIDLGLVEVIEGAGPNGESGSWIGDKIRLYTDSMPKDGSPAGVLLHEGKHHTFDEVLGDSLPEYVKDLHTLAANGNKIARDAIAHATIVTADLLGIKHNLRENGTKADLDAVRELIEQRRPGLLAEEELAYFVQYGVDAQTGIGFWKRLVNQIKAWFAQTRLGQRMKELGLGFELTDGMAVEWAKMGLNQTIAKLEKEAQVREGVLKEAANMSASERLGRALAALEQLDPLYSSLGKQDDSAVSNGEIDLIRRKYENTPQWMKAPNGKPTNLNERQWLQVRTPAFKAWFGDWENDSTNKIVDTNKEPLVVYHGTITDSNILSKSRYDSPAYWFTTDRSVADTYGQNLLSDSYREGANVIPVFLKTNNPFIIDAEGSNWQFIKYNGKGLNNEEISDAYNIPLSTIELGSAVLDTNALAYFAKQDGYDGVIFNNLHDSASIDAPSSTIYVVYDSTQIKSAIANRGTFSSTESNILYSMGLEELSQQLWNDPTDPNQDIVNKPGLLQKIRLNFIDFFAEMEKKSKDVYNAFLLLRSKKAARIEQARQEYYLPLRELIANSPWTAQEVGDMLAARHINIDKVNRKLAERASSEFILDLAKNLTNARRDAVLEGRKNILDGKMPDGKEYLDANGQPATMSSRTMRQLMFNLMEAYAVQEQPDTSGRQVVREEWELFKDAAAGFSDGGVGSNKVRKVSDILALADKDKAKFTQITNLFDAMNRHVLDILEQGKLITPAEHARLLVDKSAYAPLRRESYNFDKAVEELFRKGGQGGSKQVAVRTGTAALSEPTLVLQNALAKVEAAAAAAERNLANTQLYEVISQDKAGWKPWFSIVDKDVYVTHDEHGFLSEKNATGVNTSDIILIRDGKRLLIRPNMHNGRATGFVRAVNNLDAQMLSGPMKVLNGVNQLVRAVNITFSPVFLMRNAIMDPFTSAYNLQASEASKYTGKIFGNYGRAFKMLKKVFFDGNRDPNDPDVQKVEEWENAGGRASFIDSLKQMDDTWRSFDAQVARRQGSMKYLMKVKDTWIDGIENFNLLFENVMRFSTFLTLVENNFAMKNGAVDTARAARISQDLTTNYTRRGYQTQMLGTWWLFFNASVQGSYQVVRNLISSPRLLRWSAATVGMAVMLDLLGRELEPDDWDKIPDWEKERNIIIPFKVYGDFVKIPAPWVYNTLWRMGSMMGEVIAGKRKVQDFAIDTATIAATSLSPLGKPGSIAQLVSPTAADPFVQILENKDFSGNPIGPEGYPGASKKANSELLWSSTPKGYQTFARFVNEATGGSAAESGAIDLKPGDYQLLANFLMGSLGRFLSDSTFGFKKNLEKGIEGPKDIPVLKEFFSDPYDPMSVKRYHTNIASIYGAHRLEQMYLRGPDRDLIKLQEVRQGRGEELRMYAQAQDVERQLKSLRVRLRAAQKREDNAREKEIRIKMERIQDGFNEKYQQRVK